jgi:hypothetical protein
MSHVLAPDVHRGRVVLVTGGGADAWGDGAPAPQLEVAL